MEHTCVTLYSGGGTWGSTSTFWWHA